MADQAVMLILGLGCGCVHAHDPTAHERPDSALCELHVAGHPLSMLCLPTSNAPFQSYIGCVRVARIHLHLCNIG